MSKVQPIKIEDIILDSSIYPRNSVDHKSVSMYEENMRDGFEFDPIHLQKHPDEPGKYRILDGAHRFKACKGIGEKAVAAEIINLNGTDPLLYAARQAIGPRLLNDEEARNTARRAYQNNPKLSSEEIGKDVGRSRRTVDSYISDLMVVIKSDLELNIFSLNLLSIPQERISERLEQKYYKRLFGENARIDGLVKSRSRPKNTELYSLSSMPNRVIIDSEANMRLGFFGNYYYPTFYGCIRIDGLVKSQNGLIV